MKLPRNESTSSIQDLHSSNQLAAPGMVIVVNLCSAVASRRSSVLDHARCLTNHISLSQQQQQKRKLGYDTHLYRMINTGICSVSERLARSRQKPRAGCTRAPVRVRSVVRLTRLGSGLLHCGVSPDHDQIHSHATTLLGIARQARGSQGPRPVRQRPRPVRARGRVISSLRARTPACRLPRRRLAPRISTLRQPFRFASLARIRVAFAPPDLDAAATFLTPDAAAPAPPVCHHVHRRR
jgi:hypothetical protein